MYSLTLQNAGGDNVISSGDILGRINFAVPSEADGAAATYISSYIACQAEGSFTTSSNPASLVLATSAADSAPASGRLKISQDGHLLPLSSDTYDLGSAASLFRNAYVNTGILDIIQFNTNNGSVNSQGQLGWNDTEGTLDISLTDSTVMEIGQHKFFRVRNTTGSPLYKGQVVYASGVHANGIITPNLYIANDTIDEIRFIGLVFDTIAHNSNGYVIDFGHLRDLDLDGSATNYAVGDESWDNGDILYAHPTVAGKLTKIKPKHAISLAIILSNASSNGQLFVRPTNFGDLSYNHDVDVSGVTNGQFLQYDSVTDYWVPSSSGNFTSLQVNSTAVPTGIGASNYITKWTGANSLGTGIIYDDGNNIGIGTSFPLARLHIRNPNTLQNPNVIIQDASDLASGVGASIIFGGKFNTAGSYGDFAEIKSIKESSANNNASASLAFSTTNIADMNERMRITSSGNVGIGTSQPSQKLDVNGNTTSQIFLANSIYGWSQAPSFSFSDDPDTGWYYESINLGAVKFLSTSIDGELVERVSKDGHQFKNKNIFITSDSSSSCGIYIQGSGTDELKILTAPSDCSIGTTFGGPLSIQTYGGYNTGAQTRFGLGTATAPSIVFYDGGNLIADDDTGFWHPSTNNLAISTAGLERLRIDSNGNVGIGTNLPTEKLDVNGSIKTITGGIGHEDQGCYVAYPGGGTFSTGSATNTGYLKITLPVSWTSTMLSFDIDIYEYTTQKIKKFRVGGYNFTGNNWVNVSALMDSDNDFAKYKVHFGHDGTKCAVYISEIDANNADLGSATTWNYCKVSLSNFFAGHTNSTMTNWADGWAVGFTTTLGTTTGSIEVSRPYRQHDTSYVFNEYGGNVDFRVEGDNDSNLLFTDASADRVGIKTSTPTVDLEIGSNNSTPKALSVRYSSVPAYLSNGFDGVYSRAVFSTNIYNTSNGSFSWSSPFGNTNYSAAAIDLTTNAFGGGSQIRFYTATVNNTVPTERMHIDGDGNVGIGTDTPVSKLHVNGEIRASGNIVPVTDNTGAVGTAALTWNNGQFTNLTVDSTLTVTSTLDVRAAIDLADSDILRFGTSDDWEFYHNGTHNYIDLTNGDLIIRDDGTDGDPTRLYLTRDGNLGIGTTGVPSARLNIENGDVIFNDLGGNFDFRVEGDSDADLLFTDASTDRVGIGLGSTTFSVPTEKLDIKGSFGIYQTYKIASSDVYTSGAGSVNGVSITLNQEHGTVLNTNFYYLVRLHTNLVGSGLSASLPTIDSGSSYLVWYNRSTSSWIARAIGLSGTTAEHPLLDINGSNAIAYTNSPSNCRIYINVEAYFKTLNRAVPHYMGSDYHWQRSVDNLYYTDGNVGIGTPAPAYKLDVNGTFSANSININNQYTFPTADGSSGQALVTNGSGVVSWTNITLNQTVNGRLTLESGVAISTTNQTAKTTLYFTPYLGNQIALYNGTEWQIYSFSELNLSLSGYTASTNYDIFIYDNSGTLTLESTAWTNGTTRATSLVLQDGIYVKNGATTRRYLGTIRMTETTGQCEDSLSRRFIWNAYNQVEKLLSLNYYPGAPHTYTTSAWRAWNNNTTVGQTRVQFVRGLNLSPLETKVWCEMINGWSSIGIDSTSNANSYFKANSGATGAADSLNKFLSIAEGFHYFQILQYGTSGAGLTSTFYSLYAQASFLG